MKRYIRSGTTAKIEYELLGYAVNDYGQYAKVSLNTLAVSEKQALSNLRSQVKTRYPGWSLVTDPKYYDLRQYTGPRYNKYPKLPDQFPLVKI